MRYKPNNSTKRPKALNRKGRVRTEADIDLYLQGLKAELMQHTWIILRAEMIEEYTDKENGQANSQ